jgi:hypothetical protein
MILLLLWGVKKVIRVTQIKKMKRRKKIHLTTQILPFRCQTVYKKHHMCVNYFITILRHFLFGD